MKIVVPIMPRNLEEVEAIDVGRLSEADLIEWRADYLPKEEILTVAPAIFEKCNGKEVIFTVRTTREGGHLDLADQEYVDLIKEVAAIYQPDYIDFEYYSYQSVFDQMLEFPNLVLSYHNFDETPANYLEIMSELTSLSPAVVKMAVLANSEQDVLDVMNYTRGFKTLNAEQTFATIAMGELGKITRIAGVITGSCWTFASLDEVSAPGQMSLANTRKFLEILEN
ncbi:TPA: type I 3-dehydroquinate dehydratase [Streptococcus suis]|nr:type I 3-dehydroquinate dehydratase [Streptococcus suis]HEM3695093.1 type I 3-dehydroquinate dehydratase [Streptococcus suis]HEM3717804.1 type I 3-dehydroquinate dehydratase [Streptococcus suis]